MTATDRKQATIDRILDTRGAELRLQAIRADNALRAMTLEEMLEWWGGDIAAQMNYPSPAAFRSALNAIKEWQARHF